MHLIQIVRYYLGLSQQELAKRAGVTQADICEMEIKAPYGRLEKYQRLSNYLGIPIYALVTNDCTLVPLSFFEKHQHTKYKKRSSKGNQGIGRDGEDTVLQVERERLEKVNPSLAKLIIPHYKLGNRPGYDILSFDDSGKPFYIEVKTSTDDGQDFTLTKQEYCKANKAVAKGESYFIYRFTNWGTVSQKMEIHDYKNLKEQRSVWPATYLCSISKPEDIVSGIRHYREVCGMSKSEMADCLGIQTCHLWRYETGEYRCSVEMYQQISMILGVTIDELAKTFVNSDKNLQSNF